MFVNTIKPQDKISVVGNPYIPNHHGAEIVSIDKENGIARIKYILDGAEKTRNIELSQICPPMENLAKGLAECMIALIKIS